MLPWGEPDDEEGGQQAEPGGRGLFHRWSRWCQCQTSSATFVKAQGFQGEAGEMRCEAMERKEQAVLQAGIIAEHKAAQQ